MDKYRGGVIDVWLRWATTIHVYTCTFTRKQHRDNQRHTSSGFNLDEKIRGMPSLCVACM